MKREKVNATLYDSMSCYTMSYKEYEEVCRDNDWECKSENSQGYWEDLWNLQNWGWDDFVDNLKHCPANNQPCMIVGHLGLWHGNPEIVPVKYDTIYDAIMKCISGDYDKEYEIKLADGHLEISVSHHDGCHALEIWLLSEKGKREAARPIYEWEKDYAPKRWWFKNIYGWLF